MKAKLLFSLIALTFFLASCDKDDNTPKEPTITGKWRTTEYYRITTDSARTVLSADTLEFDRNIYFNFQTDNEFKLTAHDTITGNVIYTATGRYLVKGNKIELPYFETSYGFFQSDAYYIDELTSNRLVFRDTIFDDIYKFQTIRITKAIR